MGIDMTALIQMSKSFPGQDKSSSGTSTSSSSTSSNTDPCGEGEKNPYLTLANCTTINTGVIDIVGTVKVMENKWLTIKDGVYIYDLRQVEKIVEGDKEKKTKNDTSTNSSDTMSPKSMGLNYTYVLTMPGEIVYSDIGTISGSTLTMDYFDVIKLKTAYVVSKDIGVVLTADGAKALTKEMVTSVISEVKAAKREIKILSQKQQKQVRNAIANMDNTRLQTIIDRIDMKIEQIQIKKVKMSKDLKSVQILEDIKTLIEEVL